MDDCLSCSDSEEGRVGLCKRPEECVSVCLFVDVYVCFWGYKYINNYYLLDSPGCQELDILIEFLQQPSEENIIIESLINKSIYKLVVGMTCNFLIHFLFGDIWWFLQLGQIFSTLPLSWDYMVCIQTKLCMITKLNEKNTNVFLPWNIFNEW